MCSGDTVRAWVRDADGLRAITLEEDAHLTRDIDQNTLHPFIMMFFHVLPDRQRVVFGFSPAPQAGRGWRYLVQGEGEEATLESDPTGGFWMS